MRYPAKEKSRHVRSAIRTAFVEVWDSISVMEDPTWPRDEYDAYIGGVFELLVRGATDTEIAEHLKGAEARMGMDGSRVALQSVVDELKKINITGKPGSQ